MIKETKETFARKEESEGYFVYQELPEGQLGLVRGLDKEIFEKLAEKLKYSIGGERVYGGWRNKWVDEIQTEKGPLKFIIKMKENPGDYSQYADSDNRHLYRSVIHEIIINLEARKKYKEIYGEDLPAEKPIGFFIDKNKDRFVFFEYIEEARHPLFATESGVYGEAVKFVAKFRKRLEKIGIDPQDLNETNVLYQKTEKGPKFWLIDTELWQKEKKLKKE